MLVAAIGFAVGVERLTAVDPNTSLRRPDKYSTSTDFTSTSTPNALAPSSGMLTGISRQVPKWDAMPLLESIPWTSSDATRRFNQAGSSRSCDLFSPGMNTWQDLLPARPGVAAAIGRHPVFSVALTMETAVREGLPKLSRKKIENYLRDHVLVLQSRLYHDEAGTVFFGDKLGAAFSSVKQPTVTMKPEAMIGTAITEFRTLGLYSPADSDKSKADHRTLVLAFRYSAGDELITGAAGVLKEYELIFVHMLKPTGSASPQIVVFSTSHGRTKFHQLETAAPDSLVQRPSIVASVRFDDSKFFGLYPKTPVVTGLTLQTSLSMPVESVRSRMLGLGGSGPVGLSDLLDELHAEAEKSIGTGSPTDQN
jgi:hypothetical protein